MSEYNMPYIILADECPPEKTAVINLTSDSHENFIPQKPVPCISHGGSVISAKD